MAAPAAELAAPLQLLEEALREGDPVPEPFAQRLREEVEAGNLEVLVARIEGRAVGVAVLAYRLNVAAGRSFATIEDLYVRPDARRQGVGRALLERVKESCPTRYISYVEVQVKDHSAAAFYAALGFEPEPGVRVLSASYAL